MLWIRSSLIMSTDLLEVVYLNWAVCYMSETNKQNDCCNVSTKIIYNNNNKMFLNFTHRGYLPLTFLSIQLVRNIVIENSTCKILTPTPTCWMRVSKIIAFLLNFVIVKHI